MIIFKRASYSDDDVSIRTMMRLRPKLGSERDSEWRCCFCLHVRTGTILIGTWHLMLHLMALVFLAAIARDNRLMVDLERDSMPGPDWSDVGKPTNVMPTPLSNIDLTPASQSSPYPQHGADGQPRDHALLYHDVDVGALVTVCTLAVTLMLVYGAARGKPAHLLPFFCLQIFDFAITVLTATGYLCYLRSIHRLVAETRRVPWRAELLQLPAPALALVVLSAFLVAVLLKGYCINVVWRCYKYCTWRATILNTLTPFVISSEGLSACGPQHVSFPPPSPDYSSLLPDYEEAVKQLPPPSYRAATLMTTETETAEKEKQSLPATPPPVTAPAIAAPATTASAVTTPATSPPAYTAPVASETMVVLPQLGNESQV